MKILAIEDNPADVELIRELLLDLQVSSDGLLNAGTLAAARTLLSRGDIDFVLLDLGLPDSQGIDTLRTVRSSFPSLPIVVITGFDDDEAGMLALREGAQDYLVKGQITRSGLVRSIRYADERNRIEQELIRKNNDLDAMNEELASANEELTATQEELTQNIDELTKADKTLHDSEERYRTLFDGLIEGFCIIEVVFDEADRPVDYRFLEINPAFEAQTGLHDAQGKLMREMAPDHEEHWFEIYGKIALTGKPEHFENEARALNRWYEVRAFRVGGKESRKVAICFSDITERKRMEEELQTTLQRFYRILSDMPYGILLVTDEGRIEFANHAFCDIFGFKDSPADLSNLTANEMIEKIRCSYLDPDTAVIRIKEIVSLAQPVEGEDVGMCGERTFLRDFIPIRLGEKNYGRLWIHVDITDRKRAEDELKRKHDELNVAYEEIRSTQEELRQNIEELSKREQDLNQALAEKEILLSEVHHRVKNNLTAFISLLSLDGSYDESEAGQALRKDLQNRARSMALIHETLYRTGKFSKVDMDVYLNTLVCQIADSYTKVPSIRTEVHVRGIVLDIAKASTAGLIINELVTNSFKYAFPPGFDCMEIRGEPCTIRILLSRKDGTYVLTVADNGRGLPAGLDPRATKSLGLKLVNFLARHQLRAEIEVRTDKGTEFIFRLNNAEDYA